MPSYVGGLCTVRYCDDLADQILLSIFLVMVMFGFLPKINSPYNHMFHPFTKTQPYTNQYSLKANSDQVIK